MKQYVYLITPLIGWTLSQLIKISLNSLNKRQVNLSDIFRAGNMPSSHVCGSTALLAAIGVKQGVASPLFALAFVFTVLIAYDSVGVRRTAAEGAEAINRLNQKLNLKPTTTLHIYKGHTPWEVLGGLALGVVVGVVSAHIL